MIFITTIKLMFFLAEMDKMYAIHVLNHVGEGLMSFSIIFFGKFLFVNGSR